MVTWWKGGRSKLNFDISITDFIGFLTKIVSEYDQEIPQSQTSDNPMAPQGRAAQPSKTPWRQNKQSNQLSLGILLNGNSTNDSFS